MIAKQLCKRLGYLLFIFLVACGQQTETLSDCCKHCPLSLSAHQGADASLEEAAAGHLLMVADTITYDVAIINPDPNDEWTEACLQYVNNKALADYIFSRLSSGDLTARDFFSGELLSRRHVNKIIKETRDNEEKIGKIQFVETWQIDTARHVFNKRVESIIMGSEVRSSLDEHVGYKPLFMVDLP